ncbi:MAG: CBS domain-containing protein [Acidimicrobiia bacterium]
MRVRDLMTTDVITVSPDASLKEAARRMVDGRVSGLPVTNEDGGLVGIITEGDFLRWEAGREQPHRRGLLEALFGGEDRARPAADTVGEVMVQQVASITPDASLAAAARIMARLGVRRLPVVDPDGRVVGILSRADVVNAFTRPDDVIEDEIREDVLRRILFLEPDTIVLEVEEGVVTLGGELATRTDVRLLEELSRRLEGVVRVKSSLTWRVDDTKAQGYPIGGPAVE